MARPTSPPTVADVRADLIAEQDALDDLVADIDDDAWATPTASERWSVADQIGHLAFFDETASWAIADADRWAASLELFAQRLGRGATGAELDEVTLGAFRAMTPAELLVAWRANRAALAEAALRLADDDRVPWYGPSMGAKSFLTARLMECWAHGQHVADALGVERVGTDRLIHIAQLGYITRGWTYRNRGLDVPGTDVRVELTAPNGATWGFGPDDAADTVTGTAADFCLVVTQCRHPDATDLVVVGDEARRWLEMSQAFAGPPTDGPEA